MGRVFTLAVPTQAKLAGLRYGGVRVGDGYFNSQNLSLHIGEVVLVSKSENGYEAVTKDGKRLGKLTPYRREGR